MSPPETAGQRGRAMILVVERDENVRALERYFLEQAGYTVEFVDDGAQALAVAKALRPRILITEILVPGMDGLSVCRAIKNDPQTAGIVVLVFSILAAEERATAAGADGFLRKPLNETVLIARVASLLERLHAGGSDGTH